MRLVLRREACKVLADSASLPDVSDDGAGNGSDQEKPSDASEGGGSGTEYQTGKGADPQAVERIVRLSPGWEPRRSVPAHGRLIVQRSASDF